MMALRAEVAEREGAAAAAAAARVQAVVRGRSTRAMRHKLRAQDEVVMRIAMELGSVPEASAAAPSAPAVAANAGPKMASVCLPLNAPVGAAATRAAMAEVWGPPATWGPARTPRGSGRGKEKAVRRQAAKAKTPPGQAGEEAAGLPGRGGGYAARRERRAARPAAEVVRRRRVAPESPSPRGLFSAGPPTGWDEEVS